MAANNPSSERGPVSAEHHNDQVVHKAPDSTGEKAAVPANKRRIHTEPDLIFAEIVESAARQSAS